MKYTVRYDASYYPNGSKTKLYVGTIRQLSNATDTLRIEFASLPSGFTPYLNVARYAKDKSYIDSTPTLIGFDEVTDGFEKTLIQWYSEIAGYIDVSVTLLGAEIGVEGAITQERIECGVFYLNIEGVVISQGDSLPPPPPVSDIEFKVDKDLSLYDEAVAIFENAFTYVDNDGIHDKIGIVSGEVATDVVLWTGGKTQSKLDLKQDVIALNGIGNDLLAQMPTMTLKGNDSASTADPQDLTVPEIMALLSPLGKMEVPHDLEVLGNFYARGSSYEVILKELLVKDPTITLRDGALTGLATGEYAGFIFHLYDGTNDGYLVVDKDGYAKVGDVGSLQILATRQDSPIANGLAYWNDTLKRFDTDISVTVATLRDHSLLTNRTIADQHPISSITDLTAQLAAKAPLIEPTFTNNAVGDVALTINAMVGTTASLFEVKLNNSTKMYVSKDGDIGGRYLFLSNAVANDGGVANARIDLNATGTVISRNIADTNPALKVNLVHASSTGNIANFQFGGVNKATIDKDGMGSFLGGILEPTFKNNAVGDVVATINGMTGQTANLLSLQVNGVEKAYINKDGYLGLGLSSFNHALVTSTAKTITIQNMSGYMALEIPPLKDTVASTWSADATYSGFGYRSTITATGVSTGDIAEITFAHDQAISGNYSPVCETGTNLIYIYSKVNTSITIPTITIKRVV